MMDRQTIIQWALEADIDFEEYTGVSGRSHVTTCGSQTIEKIEAFAKLVADAEAKRMQDEGMVTIGYIREQAAKEREACAMVCEQLPAPDIYNDSDKSMWDVTCMDCAEAIRNRGK